MDGEPLRYIGRNRHYFMTPFEARAERLGIMREKARYRLREPDGQSCGWARELLHQYDVEIDHEVELAIGSDLESLVAFQDQVTARIAALFDSGQLTVLRCPACNRVAFTPETRQCVWCGHNWRHT